VFRDKKNHQHASFCPTGCRIPDYIFPKNFFLFLSSTSFLLCSFPPLASRKLFLSILVLFHFLNAFTASFFICSHSLFYHSFFLPVSFAAFTTIFFFVVPLSITSFSSTARFSTSCSLNLTFSSLLLYSATPCSYHIFIGTFF
jgi:hypothetical protein